MQVNHQNIRILFHELCMYTVKPETLTSGNFDKFGESGSNQQTSTFQSKAIKQNKQTK